MKPRSLVWIALVTALNAGAAVGQTTEIITGRVTGPTEEPISGASVRATSGANGIERGTITNEQGRFTLVFPQGGGEYQLVVSFIGMETVSRPLVRVGDEEVLVAEIQLGVEPIELQGVDVTARRAPNPFDTEPGSQERALSGAALDRLPIDANDLAAIAALTPGVIALADSLGAAGFSVLGQGPAGNQVTLDGMSFSGDAAGGGTGVPQEAIRTMRMITNTYDVSRGQFSGGQMAFVTRGGTSQHEGSFNYSLRDPTLQWASDSGPFGGTYQQNLVSGGIGGPILENRLFYFGSLQYQQRSEGLQSLLSADAQSLQRLGASPDSVSRFLSVLDGMGLHTPGLPAPGDRESDNLNLLGRVDFNVTDLHTLTLRGDARLSEQNNFRSGALGLPETGGSMEGEGGGLMLSLTSQFGNGWVNELRGYASENSRGVQPNTLLPEGRVRVSSDLEDGSRGITSLSFGGGSSGSESTDRMLEVSNELSILLGLSHRVRLGGLLNSTSSVQQTGEDFGTYTFNSLADLEAGNAAAFTRSLVPDERQSGGINAALYGGDTWRVTDRLQLTYGLRLEGSSVGEEPAYNPQVEERFGHRTDQIPTELRVSPRVGFSYTLTEGGAGGGIFGAEMPAGRIRIGGGGIGGMMGSNVGNVGATVLRGGFGEFRASPPWGLFSSATDATGLPDSRSQLFCVGDAVPAPDWGAFASDFEAIPSSCLGTPSPIPVSGRGSSVIVFDPGFQAARTWRGSLGFQHQLLPFMGLTLDATYARGVAQQGVRDLNLDTSPEFTIAAEGDRPVYVPTEAIVPTTGEVGFLASRIYPELGQVSEMHSDLQSSTTQLTIGLSGMIPRARTSFQTSYTYGRSRDQGSGGGWGFGLGGGGGGMRIVGGGMGAFVGGLGGFGAFGGASLPISSGNPNDPEWATSDFERRHSFVGMLGRSIASWLDLSIIGRATSGSPFTPLVGGDINGDGARNDPAFVFDPAATADAGLAADMTRLLETLPASTYDCLGQQMGQVAERNTCFGPWDYSLDFQANLRPLLPGVDRRLSFSIQANNSLAGLDQLLHGSNDLQGWGQRSRIDPILLYPQGFDPATQGFQYEVNERFGAARESSLAIRNPFQIEISGRLAVGAQRGAFGPVSVPILIGGPGGGRGGLLGAGMNPLESIVELADSLDLTAEQLSRLETLSDSLVARQARFQIALREQMRAAFQSGNQSQAMETLRPRLEEARQLIADALAEAEEVLTPEQWARVPASVKEVPEVPQAIGGGAGVRMRGGPGGAEPTRRRRATGVEVWRSGGVEEWRSGGVEEWRSGGGGLAKPSSRLSPRDRFAQFSVMISLPLVRTGTVRGACPHDCPDTCAMLVHLEDGRAVRVQGDPDHPVTQGFLCTKVNRYVERTYHADRLTRPMRRVGPKGAGQFEPATWDEALDDIGRRLRGLIDEHGPQAILPYSYAGTMGQVQGASMDRRFFHRIGASLLARTICATAGTEAWKHTYGDRMGPTPEEAEHAKLIVLWGTNTLTSNPHLWPALLRARERGARIIAIDPIRTRTAAQCDLHLAIRPGTDAALALGMMHVILRDGLEDRDYLERYTEGWERLPAQVAPWTPERTAAETGLPSDAIVTLARDLALERPALIRLNYGLQRHAGGGMAVRSISLLPALTGAWRDVGGGATLSTSGAFHFDSHTLERPDWIPPGTRTINMIRLGDALTQPDAGVGGPPVKALVVYNSNPGAVAPDLTRVREGLRRDDLFTVVLEHFQTDTADYADWLLPATTQLEHWDVHGSYGHLYVTLNRPAIEPVGESLPNSEIFRRLADRLGLTDPELRDSDLDLIEQALSSGHPSMEGITLERLMEEGYARLAVGRPFAPFATPHALMTPSGRIQIHSPALEAMGFDGMPCYIPPSDGAEGGAAFPLTLLSPPEHPFLNSTFVNVPALDRAAGAPKLLLHPDEAAPRGIEGGEWVRVWNGRGDFRAVAMVTEDVRPGVAVSYGVRWARRSPDGKTVNDTTSQGVTDLGGGAVFYDNAVEVEVAARSDEFEVMSYEFTGSASDGARRSTHDS